MDSTSLSWEEKRKREREGERGGRKERQMEGKEEGREGGREEGRERGRETGRVEKLLELDLFQEKTLSFSESMFCLFGSGVKCLH